MNDDQKSFEELGNASGALWRMVYQYIREGNAGDLPPEFHSMALAVEAHLDVPQIHNAIEFADVRDGTDYMVGEVNPLAHIAIHAAAEDMLLQDPGVAEALAKLTSEGATRHQAIHILSQGVADYIFEVMGAVEGANSEKAKEKYEAWLLRLRSDDPAYRKNCIKNNSDEHPWEQGRRVYARPFQRGAVVSPNLSAFGLRPPILSPEAVSGVGPVLGARVADRQVPRLSHGRLRKVWGQLGMAPGHKGATTEPRGWD